MSEPSRIGSNMSDNNKIILNSIWKYVSSDKENFYIITGIDDIKNIIEMRDLDSNEIFSTNSRYFLEYFQHVQ